ncbi:hypothetical protein Q1695_014238 [Nippostrongylus brasiliensis]|nr:hypothetical protein Q1695_014238 [Nippostrongylus brasiliensis]
MADDIPVKVFVRARPFSEKEKLENARECLQIFVESNQISCNGRAFTFDGVLDPQTPQDTAYDVTSSFLLEHFFKGFNCTVLAYGQTGSGKTFTMGTEETTSSMASDRRGIIPRLVSAIFEQIRDSSQAASFKVYVSMLEIYDEKVHDLLSPAKEPLQVREQGGSVFVQGLSRSKVENLVETMAQLEKGGSLRSKGQTAMNAQSSRSHAIFTISLEKEAHGDDDTGFAAKLHLVDLAGSERLKKTQAEGTRKMEGIRINEGLLALGNVISALSESGANRHIPYRDSKITRLLQDSLGGNSYTVMIACVSPADSNAEETLSTLRYADRAKKIKNKPVVNIDAGQQKIMELKEKVAALERELAETRMGFAPCGVDSNISAFEIAQMKAILAEKDNLLKVAHEKTAEIIFQKTNLYNQLQHIEAERERLKSVLTQTVEILNTGEEVESKEIVHRINDIVTHELIEQEEKESSVSRGAQGDTDDEVMDETFSIKFVDKQTCLDKELDDVMQQIKDKEELLLKAVESQKNVDELMKQHRQEMTSLQQRIDALLAEKAKLEADLKKISVNNRLAEERRRKLLEMEKQLAQFRKQMNELKKLERQKQQSEEIQKRMQAEIAALKMAKVRMVKQQKEESEKYRQWKLKHDRELVQIKQKERKRDFEAAKEKRAHDQQMLVCKQKLEEARTVNKRLQAQVERSAVWSRGKQDNEKSYEQAKQFVEAELALIGSSYEAEQMCQSLKEQRRQLGRKKMNLLRKREFYVSPDEPLKKRRSTEEGPGLSHDDMEALRKIDEDLEKIENQQMLCSDELNKLQRGCGSIDVDSRTESRWKDVFTLAAARLHLKVLFDLAASERRTTIDLELEIKGLQSKKKALEEKVRDAKQEYEDRLKEMEEKRRRLAMEFEKQKAHAEMEFLNFVNMLSSSSKGVDSDAVEELKRLRVDIERMGEIRRSLENSKTTENHFQARKGLARSRSSSCMEGAVITTEEERRTRSSRHTIHRYGDVKNPIVEVEPGSDEDPSFMDKPHHRRNRRGRKPPTMKDLSPIPDLTQIQEPESAGDACNISPRSRRLSMMLHQPPLLDSSSQSSVKENVQNETFIVGDSSASSQENNDCCKMETDVPLAEHATLVSGLTPRVRPSLGPL